MGDRGFIIAPVNCGTLVGVEYGNQTLKRHLGEKVNLPTVMWLIQNGRDTLVVDTGPGDPVTARSRFGRSVERQEEPREVLNRLGVAPERVATVVLTHLHWDHVYGVDLFPNSRFLVQRDELCYAIAPPDVERHVYDHHPGLGSLPKWVSLLPRFSVVDGDIDLMPGVRLVCLPGHTPGLMGVQVETSAGDYLITSDAVPTRENWDDQVPPGIYYDLRQCYRTFDKIRRARASLLLSHDPRVFDHPRYPPEV